MSQETYKLKDGRVVMWGKDHALGWFLDVHKNNDLDCDSVISEESTAFTGLTGHEMNSKLSKLGVPLDRII